MTTRTKIVSEALRHVGKKEVGNNRGTFVERLLARVGLGGGYPWCAAFVSSVLQDAGVKAGPKIGRAAVRNWEKWAHTNGRLIKLDQVKPGDLFFWINPNGTGHIGIVEAVKWSQATHTTMIYTIEGNTNSSGSREGDGVYRKTRLPSAKIQFIRSTNEP